MFALYGNIDPRDIPVYSIGDASRYLRIPKNTIRSWTIGRYYPLSNGEQFFEPLIPATCRKSRHSLRRLLSFTNLVELHVLRAIRQEHNVNSHWQHELSCINGLFHRSLFGA